MNVAEGATNASVGLLEQLSLEPSGDSEDVDETLLDVSNLFVGDLARDVSEDDLRSLFESCGRVLSVEVKCDKGTESSLGYGFVQMKNSEDAEVARRRLQKYVLKGRAIRVGWAQKNTSLFVGDLDPSVTTEDLRAFFAPYGELVLEETFVKDHNYGFVRYKHRAHSERAKRELNGQFFGGRPIRIGWGNTHPRRSCVYFKFPAAEAAESKVLEKSLSGFFGRYGRVLGINIPMQNGRLKGYGFVHYPNNTEGELAAQRVISEHPQVEIKSVQFVLNFGHKKAAREVTAASGRGRSVPVPFGSSPSPPPSSSSSPSPPPALAAAAHALRPRSRKGGRTSWMDGVVAPGIGAGVAAGGGVAPPLPLEASPSTRSSRLASGRDGGVAATRGGRVHVGSGGMGALAVAAGAPATPAGPTWDHVPLDMGVSDPSLARLRDGATPGMVVSPRARAFPTASPSNVAAAGAEHFQPQFALVPTARGWQPVAIAPQPFVTGSDGRMYAVEHAHGGRQQQPAPSVGDSPIYYYSPLRQPLAASSGTGTRALQQASHARSAAPDGELLENAGLPRSALPVGVIGSGGGLGEEGSRVGFGDRSRVGARAPLRAGSIPATQSEVGVVAAGNHRNMASWGFSPGSPFPTPAAPPAATPPAAQPYSVMFSGAAGTGSGFELPLPPQDRALRVGVADSHTPTHVPLEGSDGLATALGEYGTPTLTGVEVAPGVPGPLQFRRARRGVGVATGSPEHSHPSAAVAPLSTPPYAASLSSDGAADVLVTSGGGGDGAGSGSGSGSGGRTARAPGVGRQGGSPLGVGGSGGVPVDPEDMSPDAVRGFFAASLGGSPIADGPSFGSNSGGPAVAALGVAVDGPDGVELPALGSSPPGMPSPLASPAGSPPMLASPLELAVPPYPALLARSVGLAQSSVRQLDTS